MNLICPICGYQLNNEGKRYVCAQNHSFDIARQGYVNLLAVQQKHSLNPGDTREQVLSRREFLEAGYYAPIAQTLIRTAKELGISGQILDVGCGEGYYSAQLADALDAPLTGLDISKEAVRCAAAKYKGKQWLCATAAHIPVEDGSVSLLTSLFALTLPEEFHRILKEGGYYFQVLAAEDHLLGLKSRNNNLGIDQRMSCFAQLHPALIVHFRCPCPHPVGKPGLGKNHIQLDQNANI